MPRWSKTFSHVAPDGSVVTGIACGRSPFQPCSVPGCRRHATFRCDFPLQRASDWKRSQRRTCDRWLCPQHRKSVGPDRDYCPVHVRADETLRACGIDPTAPPANEPRALPSPMEGGDEPANETLPLPGFERRS